MAIRICPQCGAKNRVDDEQSERLRPVCGKCGAGLVVEDRPLEVTDATFRREVMDVKGMPVLVDCWAAWCGPCRMMTPILEELAKTAGGRYRITKLDVDSNPTVAGMLNVSSIPALFIFKDGELVDGMVGVRKGPELEARLLKHSGAAQNA